MKIVYICHPISGDVEGNVEKIKKIIRHINMTTPDVVPFAPYLGDILAMNDAVPSERARGIKNDKVFFERKIIDELWVCSNTITSGMDAEIKLAEKLGILCKFNNLHSRSFNAL